MVSSEINLGADAVHVFGSLARGEFRDGKSDIDIASDVYMGTLGEHEIKGMEVRIEVWRASDREPSFLDPRLPHETIYKR